VLDPKAAVVSHAPTVRPLRSRRTFWSSMPQA
jgi:hypothetical protein